ncbi:MAG TPA: cation diffusion facilitator family transporter, partial [Phnomibacter sp.]|nr:cation diffusion facilitator family transporter [Phnomibacter sp.]
MSSYRQVIKVQRWIVMLGIILLGIKFWAWWITNSVAILTDAVESIVNVTAGIITLYSLFVAARPRDKDHPYGHGKAEFISAGIEGTLITLAGIVIFYEAIRKLLSPSGIQQLDTGLVLIAVSGLCNFLAGLFAVRTGKRNNSISITSTGKHLISDAVSTAGLVLGLIALRFTGWAWLDSTIAIIFGCIIIFTGYKIIRASIAGIMDEADEDLLKKMVV